MLRGHEGEWLSGFAEGVGHCTSMKAEIKTVYKGPQLAKSMTISKLWVQLDSLMVVGMLRGSLAWTMEHEPLLRRCANLVQSHGWEAVITHCY